MFGNCAFTNYMLSMLLILSNMSTTFYIYPIVFDFVKSYGSVDLELGVQIGVNFFNLGHSVCL
jgi:hypothetical protein